jgi:16S rRNA (adenine1518-N6/adenine1519-N6)-dimethyltransferase
MIPESPAAIRAVLQERGLAPRKRLGQSFLSDRNLRDAIVARADLRPGEPVLEVGPGLGMLTRGLLDAGANVVAVELDRGLAAFLREALAAESAFTLFEGDVLEKKGIRGEALAALGEGFRVVANLPYSAATPFVAALARLPVPPGRSLVMVQLEVARRIAARPGEKDYGPLSVLIGLRGEARIEREIGGRVFVPPVKVRSALLSLTFRREGREEALLAERAARDAFLHRRKAVRRSLIAAGHAGEAVDRALEAAGVDPGVRPEVVSPEDFVSIGRLLFAES